MVKLPQCAFDAAWADVRSSQGAAKGAVADMSPGVSSSVDEAEPNYPLSAAQQAIWFEQMLLPGIPFANIGVAWQINGSIEPALLEAAINQVVATHDATRLVLCGGRGLARQRVLPHAHVSLTVRDFSSAINADGLALAYMQEVFSQPFHPLEGLLWDTQLVVVSPARCYWLHRFHHLVTDGLGVNIFWHACADAYNRLQAGDTQLREAAPSYLDFIKDDQNYLASPRFEQDATFWCERYADLPSSLFERVRTRPLGSTSPSQQVRWTIERTGFNRLIAFATEHGCSIAHLLISVLSVYFSRVSGVGEVVIGLPVHNRASAKLKRTFGMFSSVSPIGVAVDPGANFVQLMGTVAAELRRCYRHQRFPIAELNRRLKLAQAGRRQLFDIALSYETLDAVDRFGGAGTKSITMDNGYEQTPLAIFVRDYYPEDDVTVDFNFNTSVLNLKEVERIQQHVDLMLKSVVDLAHLPVARLPLMNEEERERVLHGFNATTAPLPEALVHTLFEVQAARTPEATALVFEATTLSYAELNARANRLAHHLIGLGVRPDSRVAIALPRSPAMVVALLATLKAGAAYVPLDPAYPAERLAFMLADCSPGVLLTETGVCQALGTLPATLPLIELDSPAPAWDRLPSTNPDPVHLGLALSNLAYVIYTSGSTGTPKGVMVEHRNLANLVGWHCGSFPLEVGERASCTAGLAFDACTWEVWPALCMGATLALPPAATAGDPMQLLDWWQTQDLHSSFLVTALAEAAMSRDLPGKHLRILLTGGDRLSRAPDARLPFAVVNNYGPTETTVVATSGRSRPNDAVIHIGRPIANTRIYILDAHGEPLPVGVPGELYIGGAGVARGYLNRPELTAERFLPDPFSLEPGARMYRTGDLGRWLPDGSIDFLGRNDHQVKIRGFRIELGEIEARLVGPAGIPGVREAVVLAREDAPGAKRLVAYLTGEVPPAETLRAHLGAVLPEYMVPAAYVALDALPLTPNGKLDRRALPAPEGDAFGSAAFEPPLPGLEQTLAELWSELLGLPRIGRHDNFFALGGHSLLAVGLIERMRRLGWELKVRALFTAPTLAGLAASARTAAALAVPPNLIPTDCPRITPDLLPLLTLEQSHIDAVVASVPGGAPNVQDIYPLAPLQEGLLFHHLLDPQADPYVLPTLLSFDSRELLDRFVAALQPVIARHDILRTAIAWQGLPEPVQVVWRHAPLVLAEVELSGPDVADQLQAPQRRHIDVRRAPLLRAEAAADPAHSRWLLNVQFHHLALDHTSMEIVHEEVHAHLTGQAQALPAPLPFRDFVAQACLGSERARHEAFFRDMLADVTEPTAPYGLLDVQGDGRAVRELHLDLPAGLAGQLRRHARRLGVSAACLFHLAYARVLGCTSGRDDVVFGTVLFGRLHGAAGSQRALGLFINTLPLRLRVDATPLEQAVLATHARLAELLQHEHASLQLAQRASGVPAPAPLFSTLLNYRYNTTPTQDAGADVDPEGAWQGMQMLHSQERDNYPLSVSVNDTGEDFSLDVQADLRIDAADFGGLVLQALQQLAQGLQEAPQAPLRSLGVLPPAQRERVLHGFNATAAPLPEALVHTLFEAQAARTPEATALVFETTTLSYAELNARANRLAHHLIGLGVRPDSRVALCLERGIGMVVALLATLKAGAAYVPLDPAYPAERLAFMLADCSPGVLLTETGVCQALGTLPATLPLIELDSPAPAWDRLPSTNPDPVQLGLAPSNLAYVIYTSGSTGIPKGVMVEHVALASRIATIASHYSLMPSDRALQFSAVTFDVSVEEMVGTLCAGATLVVRTDAWLGEVRQFWARCADSALTVVNLPTRFLQQMLIAGTAPIPTTIRLIVVGGEDLPADIAQTWRSNPKLPRLLNAYGPTETVITATTHAVGSDWGPCSVIGRPIANTRIYILDAHGEPLPVGVPGELYIGGTGVARGYLHRPELTAERFLPNPFSLEPGARMYRTGDLGRWLPDGSIDFLGRNDHQVKIRGFRIELGEIEARLVGPAGIPGVREAVVLAREDAPGAKRLVAYLTGEVPPAETLRAHLGAVLPEYMVPAAYVALDALPLTPNGKLDRRALPAPEGDAFGSAAFEPPLPGLEQTLAELWSELLGLPRIGRHDNFFALGGHSLLAVGLIERMRRLGWELEVRALFTAPTLAGLAASARTAAALAVPPNLIPTDCPRITPDLLPLLTLEQSHIDAVVASVPGGAPNVQDIYPLAPLQEGLLFHHLLDPQADPYVLPTLLSFDSRELLDRFVAALQPVIARHDILRTAIAWQGLPEPVQVVWRHAPLVLAEVDLSGPDVADQLQAPQRRHIDVRRAPLLRAEAAADPAHSRWLLGLQFHHLTLDHTSLEIFIEEVHAHLAGQAQALPAPLPFRDFVAQACLGSKRALHEAFFRRMLSDVTEPTAPYGLLDVQGDGRDVRELHLDLPAGLAVQLRRHARRLGVSAASLFHLAYARVLGCTSGRDDVVFGTVLFGRLHGSGGSQRALGLFINTLPLRLRVDATPLEQAVLATHARLAELLQHEHASLRLAQRASGVPAPAPLFSALLNYRYNTTPTQDAGADVDPEGAWQGMQVLHSQERDNYPLSVSVNDTGEDFSLDVQADLRIDAADFGGLVLQALQQLAQGLQEAPQAPLLSLGVLPPAHRERVLHGFNATAAPLPEALVHTLFEAQAARTPEATALVFEATTLSYAELNARANRLAHHLIGLGVRPDSRVALCLERGIGMVVALLATLKAGAAYVPLDPAYPAERLAFMLADCSPGVLLTETGVCQALGTLPATLPLIELDSPAPAWDRLPSTNPDPVQLGLAPSNLAYVIYTSGSTGIPKGVMVEHVALASRIATIASHYSLMPSDRALQFSAVTFDVSVEEMFGTLCAGATLVMRTDAWLGEVRQFWARCADSALTVVNLPTRFLQQMLIAGTAPIPTTIRLIVVGGEDLPADIAQTWRSNPKLPRLLNAYGPTETVITATTHAVGSDWGPCSVIGRPIANTRIYILDAHGEPLPVGVPGELYIGGTGVARGYLHRPELTAERFLPNPFSLEPGARMYRTGDLGRWLPDGSIDFLGRNDHQVKIRGFRIELGEIEARLVGPAGIPGVREAVVLAREDAPGAKRLVAYLTGEVPPAETLRAHLGAVLPEYMVPAAYVALDALPLTPNGKLDRRALPAPEAGAFGTAAFEPPLPGLEQTLAGIWGELLGLPRIGRHDNFFALGGHSLLAIQFVNAAGRHGIHVAMTALFTHGTIEAMARVLAASRPDEFDRAIAFRTANDGPRLFILPIGSGDSSYGLALTPYIDRGFSIYGLPGPNWQQTPFHTIEGAAARLVRMIRDVQPTGPYQLLGWSLAGNLAYEVAKQLLGLDETVAFLGLVDTFCNLPHDGNPPRRSQDLHIKDLVQLFIDDDDKVRRAKAVLDGLPNGASLSDQVRALQAEAILTGVDDINSLIGQITHMKSLFQALEQYRPMPLPTPIHLFTAQDREDLPSHSPTCPMLGWERLLPEHQIHVCPVPGKHDHLFRLPYVETVGAAIAQATRAAQQSAEAATKAPLHVALPWRCQA